MKSIIAVLAAITLTGCAAVSQAPARDLSGTVEPRPPANDGLTIGLLGDAQLQTRANYALVPGYRGAVEDAVVHVSIRPPALDWAARAMLQRHLESLRARGAKAIFFLGDGANNGCFDELAAGFADQQRPRDTNSQGALTLLDNFRSSSGIPVYFVLGNHDLLGAGSTGEQKLRAKFCRDDIGGNNRLLTKAEVIRLADQFNRRNDHFPGWTYSSSYQPGVTEKRCGNNVGREYRRWGCYLAAVVDTTEDGRPIQFELLDTSDWAKVARWRIGSYEQLGVWGGMSFGPDRRKVSSQTGWFSEHLGASVAMRVALMHYNVTAVEKRLPVVGSISKLSKYLADLFTSPGNPRSSRQAAAFFISAHTHNYYYTVAPRVMTVGCGHQGCEPEQRFRVTELNIGSTTDFSNYSTLADLRPASGAPGEIRYLRMKTEPEGCADVYARLEATVFPKEVSHTHVGWAAVGISLTDRHNYHSFTFSDAQNIWTNLDAFAAGDLRTSSCIGRFAARVEQGAPPENDEGDDRYYRY